MGDLKRGFLIAFIGLAGLGLASVAAAETLDTSSLPRLPGGKATFASVPTTIYVAPEPVAQTAEATRTALAAAGWQSFVAPFTARAQNPNMAIMTFKKGPQALNVFITAAPAQGNATSVSYTAIALPTDLPFPKDGSDIEYDPNRPLLTAATADSVDRVLDYYRKELGTLGWSLWSAKLGGKQSDGGIAGETTERGAFAYYIRENQKPLLLVLLRGTDGRTKVELKGVPAEMLAAAREAEINRNKSPAVAAAPAAPAANVEKSKSATDDMADAIMKQAMQVASDALKGAAAPPTVAKPTAAGETLKARAGSETPIPVPETAEDVEFDGGDGKLEFSSTSSIPAVAAFYRSAMKPLGWREHATPINRANMVVLAFSKGDKKFTLTIMQMGNKTNVTADGEGLITAAAKPDVADSTQPSAALTKASEDDLVAEESGGLPVPKRHTLAVGEQSPFRRQLTANVPLDLNTVLGFYRRELGKRDWKEGALTAADRTVVAFASPEGPAVLKLGRKNNETTVELAVRSEAKAKEAGILPKPGQGRIIFGNMVQAEAVITINKQIVKVGAGVGQKKPDGPSLDLPPGKYKFSAKTAGQPMHNDEVEISAGETWGLLVGPGGVLPLQVY